MAGKGEQDSATKEQCLSSKCLVLYRPIASPMLET